MDEGGGASPVAAGPAGHATFDRTGAVLSGRYRLDRAVAAGGMGVVYSATQLGLGRQVAVKLLEPRFQRSDPDFAKRFFLEAATASRLTHPNIVTVHDYGEAESGELFIAMELLAGRSLSEVVEQEGPLSFHRVLTIALQVGRALREAHASGVVHRDLKPGNVHVARGPDEDQPDLVKVLDFGLVKLVEGRRPPPGSSVASDAGLLLGSPKYMAPEQACCEEVDARADIYSFGVLLYYLSTGVVPFSGSSQAEVLQHHLTSPVPPLIQKGYRRPGPPGLEAIIQRCLEKVRDARYASMSQLLGELKAVHKGIARPSLQPSSTASSAPGVPVYRAAPTEDGEITVRNDSSGLTPTPAPPTPALLRPLELPSRGPSRPEAYLPSTLAAAGSAPRASPSGSRLPWAIAGTSMLGLGVVLVALLSKEGSSEPRIAPAPSVSSRPLPDPSLAEDEVRVTFDSVPRGAKVEEQGVVLGITPFILTFPRTEPDFYRVFIFRMDGRHATTVQTTLATAKVLVKAALEERQDGRVEDAEEVAKLREVARRVTGGRVAPAPKGPEKRLPPEAPVAAEGVVATEAASETAVAAPSPPPAAPAEVAAEPKALAAPAPAPVPAVAPVTGPPPAKFQSPLKAAPAPEPKKVPTPVLQASITHRVEPKLPPQVVLQRRGQELKVVALVCSTVEGKVDLERTKIVKGEPGADQAVLNAIREWRFVAGQALCGPIVFSFDVRR